MRELAVRSPNVSLFLMLLLLARIRSSRSSALHIPCLLHQIKRCTAPCVGLIDEQAYAADVKLATLFMDGRHSDVIDTLGARMQEAVHRFAFEEAAVFRDQIRSLQTVLHKQHVDSGKDEDVDVIVAMAQDGCVCVNLAMVRGGVISATGRSFRKPQVKR